ncbi:MAG: hypothetical protein SOW45_04415, partial [Prevotella sp.]|nr:hypothetical protein [Prevotella sp.]
CFLCHTFNLRHCMEEPSVTTQCHQHHPIIVGWEMAYDLCLLLNSYSNLRIKVTVAFWNFTAFGQLVRLLRLCIKFQFVRLRVRYCFFSPKGRPLKLASRYGVRWQLRPEWTFTTDV